MTTGECQICTFTLADQYLGVDVRGVQEVIRYQEMTPVPLVHDTVAGLINLRGQIVTAIELRRRLGLPDRDPGILPVNVVLNTDDGPISLLVDEIGEVLNVPDRLFEPPPVTLQGVARDLIRGAYKLTDRLLLILDPKRVVSPPQIDLADSPK